MDLNEENNLPRSNIKLQNTYGVSGSIFDIASYAKGFVTNDSCYISYLYTLVLGLPNTLTINFS